MKNDFFTQRIELRMIFKTRIDEEKSFNFFSR
jgi:hypothetical protein